MLWVRIGWRNRWVVRRRNVLVSSVLLPFSLPWWWCSWLGVPWGGDCHAMPSSPEEGMGWGGKERSGWMGKEWERTR